MTRRKRITQWAVVDRHGDVTSVWDTKSEAVEQADGVRVCRLVESRPAEAAELKRLRKLEKAAIALRGNLYMNADRPGMTAVWFRGGDSVRQVQALDLSLRKGVRK